MYTKNLTLQLDYKDNGHIKCTGSLNYSNAEAEAKCRSKQSGATELYDVFAKGLAATIFKFGHDPVAVMRDVAAHVYVNHHAMTISGNLQDGNLN